MSEQEYILFLTLEEVLEIHRDQIENYGGAEGLKDQGLLESALAQPKTSFGGEYLHKKFLKWQQLIVFTSLKITPFMMAIKELAL